MVAQLYKFTKIIKLNTHNGQILCGNSKLLKLLKQTHTHTFHIFLIQENKVFEENVM